MDESNLHCKVYGKRIYFNENNFRTLKILLIGYNVTILYNSQNSSASENIF